MHFYFYFSWGQTMKTRKTCTARRDLVPWQHVWTRTSQAGFNLLTYAAWAMQITMVAVTATTFQHWEDDTPFRTLRSLGTVLPMPYPACRSVSSFPRSFHGPACSSMPVLHGPIRRKPILYQCSSFSLEDLAPGVSYFPKSEPAAFWIPFIPQL